MGIHLVLINTYEISDIKWPGLMKTDLKMYVFPLLDLDENKKYQV